MKTLLSTLDKIMFMQVLHNDKLIYFVFSWMGTFMRVCHYCLTIIPVHTIITSIARCGITRGTGTMNTINEIKSMSREEKLKVMEALWEDLSRDEEKLASPDWHGDALRETEKRVTAGEEDRVDWSDAKKELRKRFE